MGKTNKANWEKLKDYLIDKGVQEAEIDAALNQRDSNKDKENALKELGEDKGIELPEKTTKNRNFPTVDKVFNSTVAKILVNRMNAKDASVDTEKLSIIGEKKPLDLELPEILFLAKIKRQDSRNKDYYDSILMDWGIDMKKFEEKKKSQKGKKV